MPPIRHLIFKSLPLRKFFECGFNYAIPQLLDIILITIVPCPLTLWPTILQPSALACPQPLDHAGHELEFVHVLLYERFDSCSFYAASFHQTHFPLFHQNIIYLLRRLPVLSELIENGHGCDGDRENYGGELAVGDALGELILLRLNIFSPDFLFVYLHNPLLYQLLPNRIVKIAHFYI